MSEYPRVTVWGCPGDHGCMLLDLGPGSVDLVCEDPNCTYEPFQNRSSPFAPLDVVVEPQDAINPSHYKWLPSGVEVIDVTEWLPFNLGNVVKYALRAGRKSDDEIQDLTKMVWYAQRELERRIKMRETDGPH